MSVTDKQKKKIEKEVIGKTVKEAKEKVHKNIGIEFEDGVGVVPNSLGQDFNRLMVEVKDGKIIKSLYWS